MWLHSSVVPRGASRKFHHPWMGPYKIIKKLADVTYRIQNCRERQHQLVVHFDRLKPCPKDMRVRELTQGQVISSTSCEAEAEAGLVRKQITSPTIHDSEDNHNGDENSGGSQPIDRADNNDQEVLIAGNNQDVPVISDDQNIPAASNDQDVPVASNDQGVPATSSDQDVPITGNDYQDTVSRESSDAHDQEHRYPRRSHRLPQRYADYVAH